MRFLMRMVTAVILLTAFVLTAPATVRAASDGAPFPEYPSLKANVEFWTAVYTRYTTRQGILHDSRDLSRIYAVIDLRPATGVRNRKHNRRTIKAAKAHWARLLRNLATSGSTSGWPDADLVRRLKAELTAKELRIAATQVRCQIGQADRFRQGLISSGAYIDQIRAIFKHQGLPQDLAYLPHVESSFNLKAYSKFGAAGIWQFTRSTGRRFMQIGYTVDERRDPIAASHAAARLLAENYAKLGSWPLAITAYNHGAAGMERAKRHYGSFPEIVAHYRGRTFKFASRNFYAEFLAARRVAGHYERYFGRLDLARPEKIHRLNLNNFAEIEAVCNHFDIDVATLRHYNPALRPPVFRGQKYIPRGYVLNLPDDSLRPAAADALHLPDHLYHDKQKPSRFYTVQPGDTAGRIARLHGIRLADLVLANNLDRRATIYVNQNLRLPQPGDRAVLLASAAPAERSKPPRQTHTQKPGPEAPTTPSGPASGLAVNARSDEVSKGGASPNEASPSERSIARATVVPGSGERSDPQRSALLSEETPAAEIATETPLLAALVPEPFPVTIGHLAEPQAASVITETATVAGNAVSMENQTVSPGESAAEPPYDMWMFMTAVEPAVSEGGSENPTEGSRAENGPPRGLNMAMVTGHLKVERTEEDDGVLVGYIRVEVEETLGHFADWLEIRTWTLRRLNGFAYGQVLHTHQRIKVPFVKVTREAFEERRFEYHQRIQEDFFAAFQVESLTPYRVRSGDSLWSLASETFSVPMWLLKRCNPEVDFGTLHTNQMLRIPVVEKHAEQSAALSAVGALWLARTAPACFPAPRRPA
jgi:membrane-bound lytic murein transglycosylase D